MKITRILKRKFEKSLAKRGTMGTVRFCVSIVVGYIHKSGVSPRKVHDIENTAGIEFDRKFNVDTSDIIDLSSLEIDSKSWYYGVRYQPVAVVDFGKILKDLNIPYEQFIFVDCGSGKGRALLMASVLPFKKIIGVEFSEELNRIAEKNVRCYNNEEQKCKEIEVLCMDATLYRLPEEPTVLFLFNPFGRPIMASVVKNVSESFLRHPRRIVVVYFNPVCADIWDSTGFLRKAKTAPKYCIYDTRTNFE